MKPAIFRRCALTKQVFPRNEMIRIVRLPNGTLAYDEQNALQGRSVHIAKTNIALQALYNPKKIPYFAHLLRVPLEVMKNFMR